jgi:ComF family protein
MLARISRLFYPPTCLLCGAPAAQGLCASCSVELPENSCACIRCALPLYGTERGMCGRCLKKLPKFDAAWSPFIYAQPLEWMISQLKFNAKLLQAKVLADLMLHRLPALTGKPDCIMPVPLHNKRLRQRGFNQSVELARPLARALNVQLDVASCRRLRATPPQTGMKAAQRRRNLRGAFDFPNDHNYSHVVLFDDVMTTGATLNELAGLLKRHGVQRVEVWSLARAQRNNKKQA